MINKTHFGELPNGSVVEQFSLINQQGVCVDILNLGGIIRRWLIPAAQKQAIDIVLGFDTVAEYLADDSYLGTLVGRYANRINLGKFTLADCHYQADINHGSHCLHGGSQGFNSKIWDCTVLSNGPNPSIELTLSSQDGDQGFPGDIEVKVVYTLTEHNRLKIEYFAEADQTTLYNPTNHSYFNLTGHNSGSVTSHQVQVLASHFTPTDQSAIPTGEIAKVVDTPFDFRQLASISQALASQHPQINYANGLDHNLCLDPYIPKAKEAAYVGKALNKDGSIELQIYTNMPGMQIFTANHFNNKKGKDQSLYQAHQGVCFETQFYPDAPNQPCFPSATLAAGQGFYAVTEYQVLF